MSWTDALSPEFRRAALTSYDAIDAIRLGSEVASSDALSELSLSKDEETSTGAMRIIWRCYGALQPISEAHGGTDILKHAAVLLNAARRAKGL